MKKIPHSLHQWIVSLSAIVIILLGTIALVAIAQGVIYNPTSNRLQKTGLVLIDSKPTGAQVAINNVINNKQTPYRYTNAPVGNITIGLQKSGYRRWSVNTQVVASQVTFANYAFLLPNILQQSQITQPSAVGTIVSSEKNQKVFYEIPSQLAIYSLNDNGESKQIYKVDNSAQPRQVVDIVSIVPSTGGDKLLVKILYSDGVTEVIIVDVNSRNTENLSTEFGFKFDDIRFNSQNSSELFWLSGGELKKINLNNRNISANIASGVVGLEVASDRILTATSIASEPGQVQLSSYGLNGSDKKDIQKITADAKGYDLRYIPSRDRQYISVLQLTNGELTLIADPYNNKTLNTIGAGVSAVTVNPNNRFFAYVQNNILSTLDLEFNLTHKNTLDLTGLEDIKWADDFHMLLKRERNIAMVDFNGQNYQPLTNKSDLIGFSYFADKKTVVPLNTVGQMFALELTKK